MGESLNELEGFFSNITYKCSYDLFNIFRYLFGTVVVSLLIIALTAVTSGVISINLMSPCFMRLCFTALVSWGIFIPAIYYIGLNNDERSFIKSFVTKPFIGKK